MVLYETHTLANGLKVIVHQDKSTPLCVVNTLYHVGAKNENPEKTGFAHLFEHLMFGGSKNVPVYDIPLEKVGGENNAFTSNDVTNYYNTLPANNIETAFWLESDRMNELAFSEKSLSVQKQVVIQEYNQRYLNQPYGDMSLILHPMAYKVHPYKWPTIGKNIAHIECATMEDVKDFFYSYYRPNNATLVVAGNVTPDGVFKLAEKWYADIPMGEIPKPTYEQEPIQTDIRNTFVQRNVPANAIVKAYRMCGKLDKNYHATDLITDILSHGESSRFHQKLIKQKKIFNELDAYIYGTIDPGLLIIEGRLNDDVPFVEAEKAIQTELNLLKSKNVTKTELQKVKNNTEASHQFAELSLLERAFGLALGNMLNVPDLFNTEVENYNAVTAEQIKENAEQILNDSNCSTIYYAKK